MKTTELAELVTKTYDIIIHILNIAIDEINEKLDENAE